jgi:hypothetical protein
LNLDRILEHYSADEEHRVTEEWNANSSHVETSHRQAHHPENISRFVTEFDQESLKVISVPISSECNIQVAPYKSFLDPFRWNIVSAVHQRIFSETSISEYGYPFIFTLDSKSLFIATSRSFIFVFNGKKELRGVLDPKHDILEFGEIKCLEASCGGTYLVASYSSGYISVWETESLQLIQNLKPRPRGALARGNISVSQDRHNSSHVLGSSIIALKFVSDTEFLSGDDNVCLQIF